MVEFDPGPPPAFASLFASVPDHEPHREHFWIDWGPIFYRGRLDGTARILCIASDPGATERIAGRTLVGDAGQRVQGFLTKLGLTRSYLCLNAFAYGMFPSHFFQADEILAEEEQTIGGIRALHAETGPAFPCFRPRWWNPSFPPGRVYSPSWTSTFSPTGRSRSSAWSRPR